LAGLKRGRATKGVTKHAKPSRVARQPALRPRRRPKDEYGVTCPVTDHEG